MSSQFVECKRKYAGRMKSLISQVTKLDNKEVRIGYFEEQGNHPDSKTTLPTLMAMHETSLGVHFPARPVFSIASKTNGRKYESKYMSSLHDYITKAGMGRRYSIRTFLDGLGNNGIEMIKPVFGDTSKLVSNTVSTTKKKGKNSPMVDTEYLKDNLTYKHQLRKSYRKF